jgi:hypothetical protein
LPDDLEPVTLDKSWVALLPLLDSTVMGWRRREFYLGGHGPQLFDTSGNAGTTAWVDGGLVGAWAQDDHQAVRARSGGRTADRLARRATRFPVYPSPTMREPTR